MTVLAIKIVSALLIFAVAMLFGLIPALAKEHGRPSGILTYGEYFAHGVFLGAGLLHLLPEALSSYNQLYPNTVYPVIFLICAISIFAIQFLEQGVLQDIHHKKSISIPWISYILMVLLSIHSIIAGAALGFSKDFVQVAIIFIAIISHKGAAAFSLAVTMRHSGMSKSLMLKSLLAFAAMTPLGILFGSILNTYLQTNSGILFESIFGAIAAGTFITISLGEHGLHPPCVHEEDEVVPKFSFIGIGVALMALVAFYI